MKTPKHVYKTSKHSDDLLFKDPTPAGTEYFEEDFDGYALEARIVYNKNHEKPWVISVHGALSDFTKSNAVTFGLQERGFSQLGMNMSGHSAAGVLEPEQTTLGNNVAEVAQFYEYLDDMRPVVVIASSLGGTPGLKLLEQHSDQISKLVLFYPGIYTKSAYDKHFGQEFRDAISQLFSYRDNDTIELLRTYKGELLLIKGEYDGLAPEDYGKPAGSSAGTVTVDGTEYYSPIPKEVIDTVYDAVSEDRRQMIEIPKCGHSVVLWMRDNPKQADILLDQIRDFLER
jgi:pimeloyl-ACP methyl ester carboxylesterase